jgi:hypothetical protein
LKAEAQSYEQSGVHKHNTQKPTGGHAKNVSRSAHFGSTAIQAYLPSLTPSYVIPAKGERANGGKAEASFSFRENQKRVRAPAEIA